ncbi:MAG: membrane-bound lytic murein transglycosylase MltF [Bdellovibrionales bacterium]|nr:membrane-bound lytic murein transglycosylase MltF [Bdellovibrionales bacterium]
MSVLVVALGLSIYYFTRYRAEQDFLMVARTRGYLRILTLNSPTTFYEDRDGKLAGFEYDLGKQFGEAIGVTAQFYQYTSVDALLSALAEGKGDIAAAGLVRTKERAKLFRFGPAYQQVQPEIVCHRKEALPRELSQIPESRLLISEDTSYHEQLTHLKADNPAIRWETTPLSTEEILAKVSRKEVPCTVADSNILSINRRYYPELESAMPLGRPNQLVWVLPKQRWGLQSLVNSFFSRMRRRGTLSALIDRYYGYLNNFDYYDAKVFIQRLNSRLPKYIKLFEEEADKYDLSWRLLAAMAYQESQWDAAARSPTGVRGLMMLTLPTAGALGVTDRLDPEQSIRGGARYFNRLRKRLPAHIGKWDRTWLALAAYNVGYGHLRDAQKLAEQMGKDPYRWDQLKDVLPLLSNRRYYDALPHGYARGSEPVQYVQRIRNYELLIRVYHR